MRSIIPLILSCLVPCCPLGLTGCAAGGANHSVSDGAPHTECLVCKKNADLACLNIKVTDQTPRSIYNGQTYYFCSPECKTAFDQQPSKYAGK